ncbi:2-oxoacid:acceptor oxidoreductase subunit alpha [Calderihabitans maritimus]|uniref:2-oxoacid:ferredoxin oxidoreductase, alpha subunit n=1 Tax=Calderihabitans maritimus TaxID=1246530 RepID=A0A1Z5HRH2_9FIRM|nr:2-oxoacid:acceptor oxidoreductase subunit alpha [Calderihabitans maritimus]GAW91931.1 2-oxoacid:ferredoxin oxidoreductase, alpha subunit [Calderihabitans maritimus]
MPNLVRLARLMQGNEACAEGALAAGVRFFAGYPITPSTEIAEIMARKLPPLGGKFIQMEDEIASMAAVIGASLTGLKAMTATSGPGFSLKQENIGYAAMAEVPCVIINVQRSGPSTGIPTAPSQGDVMQSRWGTHGDHPVIVLAPASVSEAFDLTVTAVNMSEKYRVPVIVLMDEVVGHMRERVVLPSPEEISIVERKRPAVPPERYLPYQPDSDGVPAMADFGTGYRYHVTGLLHGEDGFPTTNSQVAEKVLNRLHEKIYNHTDEICMVEEYCLEDAEVVIVAYGSVARSAKRSIKEAREAGLAAGILRLATLWPFPEQKVREVASRAKTILVPELNMGQIKLEVERVVKNSAKVVGLSRVDGELITPLEILKCLKEVI